MSTATCERQVGRGRPVGRVRTVVRVIESGRHVGDILLDGRNRVWRHADTIPTDVVLKMLLAWTRRGESQGEVIGRGDGRTYAWSLVGASYAINAA